MRLIGVVTVGRSDYGILQPVLRQIAIDPNIDLMIYAGGMHLSSRHGMTISMIEKDGYDISSRIEFEVDECESPACISRSIGRGVVGFANAFEKRRPDVLVLVGDRYEMHAAALAALPFSIPMAHIHGGEITEGAIDEALRHGITKISHLHFASSVDAARRICQLGEERWRVEVSGAPSLDRLKSIRLMQRDELFGRFGVPRTGPFLLVTLHPVTVDFNRNERDAIAVLDAIEMQKIPAIFTLPNADTCGTTIRRLIEGFVSTDERYKVVENFGSEAYFSVMSQASAMVGNSSSGLIEAPSFKLPVVNVGDRQRGRLRAANVIDSSPDREAINQALRVALSPSFRQSLVGLINPYGNGDASSKIVSRLSSEDLGPRLLQKRFITYVSDGIPNAL